MTSILESALIVITEVTLCFFSLCLGIEFRGFNLTEGNAGSEIVFGQLLSEKTAINLHCVGRSSCYLPIKKNKP